MVVRFSNLHRCLPYSIYGESEESKNWYFSKLVLVSSLFCLGVLVFSDQRRAVCTDDTVNREIVEDLVPPNLPDYENPLFDSLKI